MRREVEDSGIPYSTKHNILEKFVHMATNKIAVIGQFKLQAFAQRAALFNREWTTCRRIPVFTSGHYSDECDFHVLGFPATQNTRIWCTENPGKIQQYGLQSER